MNWRIGRNRWLNPARGVMGILNVTPDSFSDGGRFLDASRAVDRALAMIEEGAEMIDVGGESTRPSASVVPLEIERERVMPVIRALGTATAVPISIDTQKPELAREALEAGASIINDVGAGVASPSMLNLVAQTGCGYICMHMQGNPRTMQQAPRYGNVVEEVDAFFFRMLGRYREHGIDEAQIVFDVGIGFGKTLEHNLELLRHLARYKKHGRPLLLGVSRKSFIGKVLGNEDTTRRGAASLACVGRGLDHGVELFRVHDVQETVEVIRMWQAIEGKGFPHV